MCRVGQNHTYTVYKRYFWQGNHQIYDIRSYTVYIYGSGKGWLLSVRAGYWSVKAGLGFGLELGVRGQIIQRPSAMSETN